MYRFSLIISCFSFYLTSFGQGSAAFLDDRAFLFTYMRGSISQQEILKVDSVFSGFDYVSYIDRNGNFKIVHNHKKYIIFPTPPQTFKRSNYLMAYTMGGQLGIFNGVSSKKVESFTNAQYQLGDSVLAYLDNLDRLKVYVFDTVYELMSFVQPSQYKIGDNIVAYHSPDGQFHVFQRGRIFSPEPLINDYQVARNLVVYHDYTGNFKAFENGEVRILETYPIANFKLTNDILTYHTNINEWYAYSLGQKKMLLNTKPKRSWQKRNVLAYTDNAGNFFGFYKGEIIHIENYEPSRVELTDDMIIYTDLYGSLWGLVKGEKIKISDAIAREWSIQNRCVVYWDLTPNIMAVWDQGKIYRYSHQTDPSR